MFEHMSWVNRDLAPVFERFAALVTAETGKEIAALKEERRKDMAEIRSLRESEESLREEVERLREALVRFGRHEKECGAYRGCVCGLDAALRREDNK